jgi:very-short-patch-repair endonuclease
MAQKPHPNPSPEGEGLSCRNLPPEGEGLSIVGNSPPLQGRGKGWGMAKPRLNELQIHARRLRREVTGPEKKLWQYLSGSKNGGFKFRRQAVVGNYIADFLCPQKALIVEVDGETHEEIRDARRDTWLNAHGYTVLRVTNDDVLTQLDRVVEHIFIVVSGLPDRWSQDVSPTPNPSPEGEGDSMEFIHA